MVSHHSAHADEADPDRLGRRNPGHDHCPLEVLAYNCSSYYAARTLARGQHRWPFLHRAASLSSLQATARAVSELSTMVNDQPIRVAIIGLGFGAEFIPIYQNYPGATLYAICRRDRQGPRRVRQPLRRRASLQ